jgi:hypothetical protein
MRSVAPERPLTRSRAPDDEIYEYPKGDIDVDGENGKNGCIIDSPRIKRH